MPTNPLVPMPIAEIPRISLRLAEAAASLGISERTLWSWARTGAVPFVRRGGILLFPVRELVEWLGEQTAQPATVEEQ